MNRFLQKLRQRFKRSFVYAFVLCVIILLGGGWGFWAIDPAIDTFGDGVWLAFTKAATVGYGDLVPSTFASRLFAVAVFMLGLTVLSLATSALTVALSKADGATAAPSPQALAESQPRLRFDEPAEAAYELPPLSLLSNPSLVQRHSFPDGETRLRLPPQLPPRLVHVPVARIESGAGLVVANGAVNGEVEGGPVALVGEFAVKVVEVVHKRDRFIGHRRPPSTRSGQFAGRPGGLWPAA